MNRASMRVAAIALVLAGGLSAQARDQREATVGMRAYVEQIVLEGSELVPAPSSFESPIRLRVLKTWPHGEHLRYDLEWMGLEPGTFDLVEYLERKDGSGKDGLEPVRVTVKALLPFGEFEPGETQPKRAAEVGGYTTTQIVLGVFWGIGLLAILFVGRKRLPRSAPPAPKPTLADRLRPLVEKVASGDADEAHKAELERLLVAFWRSRLDLGDKKAVDAIVAIKKHDEAGALLRQVEAWLHAPEPPGDIDVQKLLEPYRAVSAEDFQRRVPQKEVG